MPFRKGLFVPSLVLNADGSGQTLKDSKRETHFCLQGKERLIYNVVLEHTHTLILVKKGGKNKQDQELGG